MLPLGKLGDRNERLNRKCLVMNCELMTRHFEGQCAALVNLVHAVEIGLDAEAKEFVVGGNHAGGNRSKTLPVVMIVSLLRGFRKADHVMGNLVHPGHVAGGDDGIECGVIEQNGLRNCDGAQGPLHLVPRLRLLLRIVIEQRFGLLPLVDLGLRTCCFGVVAGGQVLIHARRYSLFKLGIDACGFALGGIGWPMRTVQIMVWDVHEACRGLYRGKLFALLHFG